MGNVEGEVIDINFRSTRIRSMDHSVVIITNSQICASTVQNAALRTMRPYKFTLGVTYGTTRAQLEKLMADLQAMLDNSPYTNKGTNIVRLTSFGDSSINILISAYLTTNVYATFLQQQNDLNLNIMDVMPGRRRGLRLPLHQRLHRKELSIPQHPLCACCGAQGAFLSYVIPGS